jgi:hypothetical protein
MAANDVVMLVGGQAGAGDGGLPPDPDTSHGYLPAKSASISFSGGLLDFIPVQVTCIGSNCKGSVGTKSPIVGIIDPSGNQHSSYDYSGYYGDLVCTLMIDPRSSVAAGSTITESDYWSLLWQQGVLPNAPFTVDREISYGISTTESTSFTVTVGAKLGGSAWQLNAELTAQLSKTLQHSVTVTSQETTKYHLTWPETPQPKFAGVYQLMQSFSVNAGANLDVWLAQMNQVLGCTGMVRFCLNLATGATFVYPTPTYLQEQALTQSVEQMEAVPSGDDLVELARSLVTSAPSG